MTIKAVGLLSGGLDSTLAARLMIDQGIEVLAINFTSPFCTCTAKGSSCAAVVKAVRQLGDIPLKRVALGDEYLEMVRKPRHGYGRAMNPCIDCRILKIKKAGEYMREAGASFLFTGEVLGQRPMSQHRQAIEIIDRGSGLGELTLRPLSARYFEPTIAEKNGWVKREELLGITGRGRKPQISLAAEKGILDYPCPAGGCRLTDKLFAGRLRDYFSHIEKPLMRDIALLKIGRHFREANGDRVIVARDEAEGEGLQRLRQSGMTLLGPLNFSAPVVLYEGGAAVAAFLKLKAYAQHGIPEDGEVLIEDDGGAKTLQAAEAERSLR